MAINYPGPYEVRLFYTVIHGGVPITHSQRLNVRIDGTPTPGTPFTGIDALRRDNSPFALDSEVDDWVLLIDGIYYSVGGSSSFDYAELWKYEAGTYDATFISTYGIAANGASATPNVPAGQVIMTFRTINGGIMKLSFMEGNVATGVKDTPPYANTTLEAIRVAVEAGTVPWYGKDNSYPFAGIAAFPGANEALFKRRYRQ